MQTPWRNISVLSTNVDDDAPSFNQWGKRHSTSPDAFDTATYNAFHHFSTSKHRFSARQLLIHPSFHTTASIFIHQLIVDNVKHRAAVSLRNSLERHPYLPSSDPKNHSQRIYHHSPPLAMWSRLSNVRGGRGTQVCYHFSSRN